MPRFLRDAGLIFSAVLLFSAIVLAAEEITITTYYPSPYGLYNQLQTSTLGVGDNNGNSVLDSGDVPNPATNPGDVWIKGKVGIGTTGPTTRLDISGDTHISGGLGLGPGTPWGSQGIYLDSGSQATPIFWDNRVNTGFSIYQNQNGNTLYFRSSGGGGIETWKWVSAGLGDLMTIGPNIVMNRNVGIGTPTPGAKLDVNGNIYDSGGSLIFSTATGTHTGIGNTAGWAAIE
ncbi:MAG: hypothetical protein PHP73_03270, partial [Candidatus Omnitrophica bacterium]|nr:hypothetical protein [Candidatus Omnitrophota bacterium]